MRSTTRTSTRVLFLAPLVLGAAITVPAGPALAGPPQEYPLAGTRSITTARAGIAPECLTVEGRSRVTLATLCFKEGEHHSWSLKFVAGGKDLYVLARGANCLTFDAARTPALLAAPCVGADARQLWQVAERTAGEYQIAHGAFCVQARGGEVSAAACRTGRSATGLDDSGQAWKVLASPRSVVPDTPLGSREGGGGR